MLTQGRTENSWGPRAIGDNGAPVPLPKLKKAYEKGTRGISWGTLQSPGPREVPECLNGQSAPCHSSNMIQTGPVTAYIYHVMSFAQSQLITTKNLMNQFDSVK
ncbi:unnamed protein product, partial [Staurois parvus]